MKALRRSPRKRRLSETSTNGSRAENDLNPTDLPRKERVEEHARQLPKSNVDYRSDEDDDDDVEFLYTNPPPSRATEPASEQRIEEETKAVSPVVLSTKGFASSFYGNEEHDEIDKQIHENETDPISGIATVTPEISTIYSAQVLSAMPISSFPHRSSAYLQSLAEICDAILWDARWRVEGYRKCHLFAWEQGDDMSAVHTLSRRYYKLPSPQFQPLSPKGAMNESENQCVDASNSVKKLTALPLHGKNDTGNRGTPKVWSIESTHGNNVNGGACNEDDGNLDGDENRDDNDRCLEMYARLYFRKGPWFRLDNVYTSYYLPKKNQAQQQESDIPIDEPFVAQPVTKKLLSPSKFFIRRNTSAKKKTNESNHPKHITITTEHNRYIDQEFVNLQMEAVVVLVEDIQRLFRMGLIRSFDSEEECGKTVGKQKEKYDYAATSLLRQDEQRAILRKLGGGQKKCTGKPKTTSSSVGATTTISEEKLSGNVIWKQMCQQQTIFHSFQNGSNKSTTVLPVLKHVHRTLVEKWASTIILKATKVEYIPSQILRSVTKSVSDTLFELTSTAGLLTSAHTIMCVRLREAPVRTLRRACRLYLCATSGPGDMRNTGTNAWRSLPDSHSKDLRNIPLKTNVVSPPGSSWNTVCYPGKDWRLRVLSCHFIQAHKPIMVNDFMDPTRSAEDIISVLKKKDQKSRSCETKGTGNAFECDDTDHIQVFPSVQAFYQWELGVEIRENSDFLLELNDLILYEERKRAKERRLDSNGTSEADEESDSDPNQGNFDCDSSSDESDTPAEIRKVDFQDVLTIVGRAAIIHGLLGDGKEKNKAVFSNIEQDVSVLLGVPLCDRPLSTLIDKSDTKASMSHCVETTCLQNECERILGVLGIILTHVLEYQNFENDGKQTILNRPWLRHMHWEGCMSYVLWDVIPLFERRGYYSFAISALEVLLFGKRLSKSINSIMPDDFLEGSENSPEVLFHSHRPLISRRARGKAIDRLIIDYTHFVRKLNNETDRNKSEKSEGKAPKGKVQKKSKKVAKPKSIVNEIVTQLTEPIIRTGVGTGQITFCSIRTLARRLKRPLSFTLRGLDSFETNELGHRLSNGNDEKQDMTKYNDWTPITDTAVANAMGTDQVSVGRRCAFIGFEEDDHALRVGSLNVEELAKEYYRQGRLPVSDDCSTKGGWHGYHDEGGKIRVLFRILSSATLGMDWNPGNKSITTIQETSTIHLTPYQGAPFDLHVGAERIDPIGPRRGGIYSRRKSSIEDFLHKLASLDGQDLANFVHDCIHKRVLYTNSLRRQDLSLESDLAHVRTLSMIAAGFGGKMLASAFRCLFFDYRHYSGGLPDLLLVRATYSSPKTAVTTGTEQQTTIDECKAELVDLGEWVGEDFCSLHQDAIKAKHVAGMFVDTDGDFLGCSKVGDSGGRMSTRFQRSARPWNQSGQNSSAEKNWNQSNEEEAKVFYSMPERLSLSHNSREIRVECMFVEVKSQNDRLDARQEDWLNILDQHGSARVCKFSKPNPNSNRTKKVPSGNKS